ncbi:3-methyladenine DNA glycosylase [Nocardioides marmorisolisilvae]|uniref:3-methyladenine DNA glycosylase n=1 Tax=Nocardioides marmorisolisilvae TaxID=1542737 RepID=UPI001FE669B0|nr:3-methyladenine DNA glycosylase [Nocardioides marmorisolisilvae]
MTLSRAEWSERARAHADRVDVWIQPHLARRLRGEKHPVHDFLFTYYSQRPTALRRWHPGYGVQLADAPEYAALKGYSRASPVAPASSLDELVETPVTISSLDELVETPVTISQRYLDSQRPVLERIRTLLAATLGRPANLGCFGLHEWAMVYRGNPAASGAENAMRHDWPLRLGGPATDEVVENHRIGCSHFDAFRFFTEPARPLNTLHPGREDRPDFEQPGCLHAGMDLYKHAFRLTPLIPSELVADAFALAWDIRILDMRAAPYDFTGVTLDPTGEPWSPVSIETAEGKATYAAAQRGFAERGAPIRERLVAECDRLLAQPPAPEADGEQAHAET